ncbi:O-antigen ligase family protein [Glaciecola sp. SC05]|uniref:O-antigen ligase family protein n=1 Tax=Glaciecola sp. SC05 TaxID=1987355 RepID=UPI003528C59C
MAKILTILLIALAAFMAVSAPYIAAVLYSAVSILQPQYIWFWVFDDISIFRISAGIAIVAWGIHMVRGGINWQIYNNGIFYGLLILLCIYYLSDLFTPFPSYGSRVGSELVMSIYTTIVLMFFIVLGLINHEKALKYLVWAIVAITLYYTYWANSNYLEGNWSQFAQGRLRGPNFSPYTDGNIFSIVFVIGLPFVLFAIYQVEKTWQKALLILAVPLIWHAMILCASRGALLSAAVSTLIAARMIKSKSFNVVLLVGALVFLIDQGGQMLSRTVTTVQQSETSANEPINPRVISWDIAFQLAKQYPILGVGPQRFLEASRTNFPGKSPHVPHNTFLNFSANLGIIAGFIYLTFFWISWKIYRWNKNALEKHPDKLHTYINKASFSSLMGFFVGSMFLDLIIFEPFYFLLLVIVANNFILKQKIANPTEQIATPPISKVDSNIALTKARQARV